MSAHHAALEHDRDLGMWGAVCTDCDWKSTYLTDDKDEAFREARQHEDDPEPGPAA